MIKKLTNVQEITVDQPNGASTTNSILATAEVAGKKPKRIPTEYTAGLEAKLARHTRRTAPRLKTPNATVAPSRSDNRTTNGTTNNATCLADQPVTQEPTTSSIIGRPTPAPASKDNVSDDPRSLPKHTASTYQSSTADSGITSNEMHSQPLNPLPESSNVATTTQRVLVPPPQSHMPSQLETALGNATHWIAVASAELVKAREELKKEQTRIDMDKVELDNREQAHGEELASLEKKLIGVESARKSVEMLADKLDRKEAQLQKRQKDIETREREVRHGEEELAAARAAFEDERKAVVLSPEEKAEVREPQNSIIVTLTLQISG